MKRFMATLLVMMLVLALAPFSAMAEETITFTAYYAGDTEWDYSENYTLNLLEEKTGIRPIIQCVSRGDDETQLQLQLSSGTYPDVFFCRSELSVSQMLTFGMKDGILIPLEDYLTPELAPNICAVFEEFPAYKSSIIAPDGHMYALPKCSMCGHARAYMKVYLNEDWMSKLGLEPPTTLDEFYNVLVAFRDNDPNGNGLKDEIPVTGCVSGDGAWYAPFVNYFMAIDVVNKSFCAVEDGAVSFQATSEKYKEAISFVKKLYDEGLIDPAIFSQSGDDMKATLTMETPVAGMYVTNHVAGFTDYDYLYQNYRVMMPVTNNDGTGGYACTKSVYDGPSTVSGKMAITDKCKNPEAVIKWVDALWDQDMAFIASNGKEGMNWEFAPEGSTGLFGGELRWLYLDYNGEGGDNINLSNAPFQDTRYQREKYQVGFTDVEELYTNPNICESRLEYESELYSKYFYDYVPTSFFLSSADETSEYADLFTNISTYVTNSTAQFITGTMDLEADWDAYVKTLDSYNVARFVELMQQGYNTFWGVEG